MHNTVMYFEVLFPLVFLDCCTEKGEGDLEFPCKPWGDWPHSRSLTCAVKRADVTRQVITLEQHRADSGKNCVSTADSKEYSVDER